MIPLSGVPAMSVKYKLREGTSEYGDSSWVGPMNRGTAALELAVDERG